MTYRDALRRSIATFVAGATSTPLGAELLDVAAWKVAALAGLAGLVNLAARLAQAWLKKNPEG